MNAFSDVYPRMLQGTGTRTQKELAALLEVSQSTIADAKRRNTVPPRWYLMLNKKCGLNPEWLEQGQSPMFSSPEKAPAGQGLYLVPGPDGVKPRLQEQPAHYADNVSTCLVKVWNPLCPYTRGELPAFAELESLSLPRGFVPPGVWVFRMDKSGMEPDILPGAYVGIEAGGKYAPGLLALLALLAPGRGLVLSHARPAGADMELLHPGSRTLAERVSREELEKRLFGRVIWTFQRF